MYEILKFDESQPRHPKGSPEGGQWSGAPVPKLGKYARMVIEQVNSNTWYHGSRRNLDIDNLDLDQPIYLTESARYASYYAAGEATGSPLSFNPAKDTPLPDLSYEEWEAEIEASAKTLKQPLDTDQQYTRLRELEELENKYQSDRIMHQIEIIPDDVWATIEAKWQAQKPELDALRARWEEADKLRDAHFRLINRRYGRPQIYPVKLEIKAPYLTTNEDFILGFEGGLSIKEDEDIQRLLAKGYDSIVWTPSAEEMDGFEDFGKMQGYAYGSELLIIDPKVIKKIRSVYRKRDRVQFLSGTDLRVLKYDQNQKRHPKGHPKGGQWADEGAENSAPLAERLTSFMEELWATTDPHPFAHGMRLTKDWVGLEVRPFDNAIHLSSIMSFVPKGKGAGTRGLLQLIALADKHQVDITGFVKPIENAGSDEGKPSLTKKQLHKWYAKHGFKKDKAGDYIRRTPKVEVEKYSKDQPRHPKGTREGGRFASSGNHALANNGRAALRRKGFDPDQVLRDLKKEQAKFTKNGANLGIRVDADLDQEALPTEELTRIMKMFPAKSYEGWTLAHGEEFVSPATPPPIKLGTPKQCFANAGKYVAMDSVFAKDDVEYVEGFVMDARLPFPIHHAWYVKSGTNEVIDPTMGWRPGAAYYGVRFDRAFLRKKLFDQKYYGLFTDGLRPLPLILGEDEDYDYT